MCLFKNKTKLGLPTLYRSANSCAILIKKNHTAQESLLMADSLTANQHIYFNWLTRSRKCLPQNSHWKEYISTGFKIIPIEMSQWQRIFPVNRISIMLSLHMLPAVAPNNARGGFNIKLPPPLQPSVLAAESSPAIRILRAGFQFTQGFARRRQIERITIGAIRPAK